jgi:hypothetical protein
VWSGFIWLITGIYGELLWTNEQVLNKMLLAQHRDLWRALVNTAMNRSWTQCCWLNTGNYGELLWTRQWTGLEQNAAVSTQGSMVSSWTRQGTGLEQNAAGSTQGSMVRSSYRDFLNNSLQKQSLHKWRTETRNFSSSDQRRCRNYSCGCAKSLALATDGHG